MEHRSKNQRRGQTWGMGQRTGQGERRLAPLQGLLRVAQQPQHPGHKGEAIYARVAQDGTCMVVLGIIEDTALGQVLPGWDKLAKVLQRLAERPMRLHDRKRIV